MKKYLLNTINAMVDELTTVASGYRKITNSLKDLGWELVDETNLRSRFQIANEDEDRFITIELADEQWTMSSDYCLSIDELRLFTRYIQLREDLTTDDDLNASVFKLIPSVDKKPLKETTSC